MGIINVRVVPNAKKNEVKKENNLYKIYLSAPAREGKANKLLVEILADEFSVRKSQVRIIRGEKSRDKIVEITQ
ncbi:MAG: DUF167 domain-containing protein [Candidatus Omnitrophota bacterium]